MRLMESHLMARCAPVLVFEAPTYLRFLVCVTLPGGALPGFCVLGSASIKMKLAALQ